MRTGKHHMDNISSHNTLLKDSCGSQLNVDRIARAEVIQALVLFRLVDKRIDGKLIRRVPRSA